MRAWSLLVGAVAAASGGFALVHLPTPMLFGGLVGALVFALASPQRLELPRWVFLGAQGIVGATVGASVDWGTLGALGTDWVPVVVVSALTLVISVAAGQLLRLHRGVSAVTASFSSIAGGASGMTALAHDLGADDRVVTVIQYLRVLVVLFSLPAVVTLVFHVHQSGRAAPAGTGSADVVFALLVVVGGVLLGRLARLPSPAILGALVVAVVLRFVPAFDASLVPAWIQAIGFLGIGVQVGLRFTTDSLRAIGAMVPTALVSTALTIGGCALLGWSLTLLTDVGGLDAYLATTPGGLYAVLATASSAGGDVTFVTGVQMLRLLLVLLLAPALARILRPR